MNKDAFKAETVSVRSFAENPA